MDRSRPYGAHVSRRSFAGSTLLAVGLALASCSTFDATVESLSTDGEHPVRSYTDLPDAPEFAAATIYYPEDAPGRVGGVAIAPGFGEEQDDIDWWGPRLASHGFVVLVLDTNNPRDEPDVRADALLAAANVLRSESAREDSPLFGRIDPERIALMGHSMGGGGALIAADEHPEAIRALIPFTPWEPEAVFDGITDPTLILTGSADRIAGVQDHGWRHFQTIPESTPKLYAEIEGAGHFMANSDRGTDLATIGRYGIAWLKRYLDGDERYDRFLYGELAEMDADKFSRFVASP